MRQQWLRVPQHHSLRDLAIDSGHAGTVRALLEGKANLNADSLHVAAEKNHPEADLWDSPCGARG